MYLRKALMIVAMLAVAAAGIARAENLPYATLSPPQPTESGKIEVIEFFWYGCPHCYHLEPDVNAWAKSLPPDVVFKRVPAYPSEAWGDAARIFYTLQAMGLLDQYHDKVFDAIHKDNVNLVNKKIRDDWLTKNGIDKVKFDDMWKSFTVASDMQRDKQMTMNYKVDGVPRLVVGGKYYTSGELAGGPEKIFPTVNQMIAKVREEQGKPPIKTTKK